MPSLPSRKSSSGTRAAAAAKAARTLAVADAAYAFLRDRLAARVPHRKPPARRHGRLVIAGAAAVAAIGAVAGAILKRDRISSALGRSGDSGDAPGSVTPTTEAFPPAPSNYDTAGPVANTATPLAAPDPQAPTAIDEEAEEAAAAAEAAAIGGAVSDYASPDPGEPADEALRPLMEAGEGEAEGQEQAEAALRDAAEPSDGPSAYERQIEEAIEAQDEPASGETPEPLASAAEPSAEASASGDVSRETLSAERDAAGEAPVAPDANALTADIPATPEDAAMSPADVGDSAGAPQTAAADTPPTDTPEDQGDWQTWSGQGPKP